MFINLLDDVYEKYKHLDNDNYLNIIKSKLYDANEYCRMNRPSKATQTSLTKCYTTGCFLFLYDNEKLLEDII
jgi:hypothetical protein